MTVTQRSDRLRPIDAARGTAMLFVFLSHFGYVYFLKNGATTLHVVSLYIGMVASPTFMLISGTVLGYLHRTKRGGFAEVRTKLADRGLFLLTIGHVLNTLAHIPTAGSVKEALTWGFITDTIGICIIAGPFLVGRLRPAGRVLFALAVYGFGWLVTLLWHPSSWLLSVLKETLLGPWGASPRVYAVNFPLLPWLSLYMMGTCIGERIGEHHLKGDERALSRYVLQVALAGLLLALLLKGGAKAAGLLNLAPAHRTTIAALASLYQKWPPSPVYFLFYGGAGLMIMYVLFVLERQGMADRLMALLSMVGRTSLFVFILQYYVYFALFPILKPPFTALWPLLFVVSVASIICASWVWYKGNYNRFITVRPLWPRRPGKPQPHVIVPVGRVKDRTFPGT
jgi:uncharacterized membrane protein